MKKFWARVEVRLKPGYLDPEGRTAEKALLDLGFKVKNVRTAKIYEMEVQASSKEEAERKVEEMCRRLLSNPVKDDYSFEVKDGDEKPLREKRPAR